MKKNLLLTLVIISLGISDCTAGNPENKTNTSSNDNEVVVLTTETFKKLIFNYDVNKAWKYEGTLPAIIDFYADWCPPCRQLSPLVEEIAKEYHGRIVVYKVNTDKEKGLTQSLGITNLPTLLYIPANGKPQITLGAIPKETLVKTIDEILLTNK
jgi:thioredoxin 1